MFQFFLAKPLWMKAAMLAGTGLAGYFGYQWFAGPSEDSSHRRRRGVGSMDPMLPPHRALAPSPEHEYADAQTMQAYPVEAPDFVEWDAASGAWMRLPEHEWHRRFGEFVSHYGYMPPHMARPSRPSAQAHRAPSRGASHHVRP
jgi:hypothetical protein